MTSCCTWIIYSRSQFAGEQGVKRESLGLKVLSMRSVIVIVLGSLLILWWSRKSLRHPSSHGFPRFFAFEAILVLVVLNVQHWFTYPRSIQQIASSLLLIISIVLVIWGVVLLRYHGESRPTIDGATEFEWENTSRLVTTGIYHYIRHPMYSSLLFLAWGTCLKFVSLVTFLLAVVATIALFLTAKIEEAEDVIRFGDEYRSYMKKTWRFVPFLF